MPMVIAGEHLRLGFLSPLGSIQNFTQGILGIEDEIGTCDGCFCIPEPGETCPQERKPITNYSSLIPILRSFTWENPYTLEYDPYTDIGCDTMPPLAEGGACVVEFSGNVNTCPNDWSYKVKTYAGTLEEAKSDSSLFITHAGPCGTCSSLQDLSVYMEYSVELQDEASRCAYRGLRSVEAGIQCFMELGFTEGCATTWFWNTRESTRKCALTCIPFTLLGMSPNKKNGGCTYSACIKCDEVKSGPIFKKYAGRTRRNSGLLSNIVRPCIELIELKQKNPCEAVKVK